MLKVKFIAIVLVLVVTALFSGCASTPQVMLPENSTIAIVTPKEVNFTCPQSSRIICLSDPEVKREPFGESKYIQDLVEARFKQVKDSGAAVSISIGGYQSSTTPTGVSMDFALQLGLTALSAVVGPGANDLTKSAIMGNSQRIALDNRMTPTPGITTGTQIKTGFYVKALFPDKKWANINCPEAVERDGKACLDIVARALEAGSATK